MDNYKKNSLTLKGAVALGTGVMIGAGKNGFCIGKKLNREKIK